MANQEHLELLKRGINFWNRWRNDHPYEQVDLSKIDFGGAFFSGINFSDADLSGADFSDVDFTNANLSSSDLSKATLSDANLSGANLSGTNLSRAILSGDLSGADISYANLNGTGLSGATLIKATLSHSSLIRTSIWFADLTGANLDEAHLTDADFSMMTNFTGATFRNATIYFTDFRGADLSRVDFSEATLHQTNLDGATLTGVNLTGATLYFGSYNGTIFSEAIFGRTDFQGVDLRDAIGLETCHHVEPSNLHYTGKEEFHDTVSHSHAMIPDQFLLGCGMSREEIRKAKSIDYNSPALKIFISYEWADSGFVNELDKHLQQEHYATLIDRGQPVEGQTLSEESKNAIEKSDLIIVVLSPESAQSGPVQAEYQYARKQGKLIIPLTCRECQITGSLEDIKDFQILNFTKGVDSDPMQELFKAIQLPRRR